MITKRIIPCLDVKNGRVVKGVNFKGILDVSDPIELAKRYNDSGADELVFYDITASIEARKLFTEVLEKTASKIFIPLTVGGGINTLQDFDIVLKAGADKVSINTGAIKNPNLISEAAKRYGNQCVVLSIDVKRIGNHYNIFSMGGKVDTGIDAINWAKFGQNNGAGEIVVNSIDTDGVKNGFDLEMLSAISKVVNIPIIASGGAGNIKHFIELFKTLPQVDAGLAASIFHFNEVDISKLKSNLQLENIPVRITKRSV